MIVTFTCITTLIKEGGATPTNKKKNWKKIKQKKKNCEVKKNEFI